MANSFGTDILIQAEDPKTAASFYVNQLGFEITGETPEMISLEGEHINLFIERGPALAPVLEITVNNQGNNILDIPCPSDLEACPLSDSQ